MGERLVIVRATVGVGATVVVVVVGGIDVTNLVVMYVEVYVIYEYDVVIVGRA